jgi:hypothetical protein
MLTMLAISIPLLTIQIDYILQYSRPAQLNRMAANAYAAGYIGLVIIQYIWVLVIGSEPKSYLGQFAHDDHSMQSSLVEPQFYSEKQAAHIISHNNINNTVDPNTINHGNSLQDFSQVFIPHAITTSNDTNSQPQQQQQEAQQEQQLISEVVPTTNTYSATPSVPQNNTSNLAQLSSNGADFKEKVEAIHSCKYHIHIVNNPSPLWFTHNLFLFETDG